MTTPSGSELRAFHLQVQATTHSQPIFSDINFQQTREPIGARCQHVKGAFQLTKEHAGCEASMAVSFRTMSVSKLEQTGAKKLDTRQS